MDNWPDILSLKLIENYKAHKVLWDRSDPNYTKKIAKEEAWKAIADTLDQTENACKRKLLSLQASYRRERSKEKNTRGKGISKEYRSRWFAFNALGFLKGRDLKQNQNDDTYKIELTDDNIVNITHNHQKPKKSGELKVKKAFYTFQQPAQQIENSDSCSIYGIHVANKLRRYNQRTRAEVEFRINEILYAADLGKYNTNESTEDFSVIETELSS